MNNPVCVVEVRKGLPAKAQGLSQNGTVFDTEFRSNVLIVEGVDCVDDLGVAGR